MHRIVVYNIHTPSTTLQCSPLVSPSQMFNHTHSSEAVEWNSVGGGASVR